MRRTTIWMIGWLLILCVGISAVMAEDISKDVFYNEGIRQLDDMTADSVKSAVDSFAAAGKYGQARSYRQYAKSLLEILMMDDEDAEVDVETVIYRLEEISQTEGFSESLEENEFPSCEMLIIYVRGRQDEQNGNYIAARNAYGEAEDVLDALDRRIDLTPKAYRQAEELYQQGNFDAVVEALKDMTYKDSETMYRESLKHVAHIWMEADCNHPRTCSLHGETEGEPLGHQWAEATCTAPRTCVRCGLTEGEPAGHSWAEATCTAPRTCTRCGATSGEALGHIMTAVTCTEPSVCTRCGAVGQEALGHDWSAATCTEPSRCTRCGLTNGAALGHDWRGATCTDPEICSRCGAVNGYSLGHNWTPATCTEQERCTRCGATNGYALGHSWQEATYSSPKRCSRCGLTEGSALPPTPEPRPSTIMGRATSKLSLNAGPGTASKYQELGTYDLTGQYVELLARSYDYGNEIWWIKCSFSYGGRTVTGWTGLKRFDQSTFNLEDLPVE